MPHIIFYSWQSDLPNSTNRGFIQDALEQAVENLKKDGDLTVEPVLDRDTAGVAGSPDIAHTIFAKIDKATAFVCDVSIINHQTTGDRPTPNPNVLIELGFALRTLGAPKIVMVMNNEYGEPESLPFDLKQKRIVTYKVVQGDTNKASTKRTLAQTLTVSIKAILTEAHKESASLEPKILPAAQALEAINASRPDQGRLIGTFMKWLGGELQKLDPHSLPGEADENLVDAINNTIQLVQEFERVADAISAMKSEEGASALYRGFEHLLRLCYLPENFSGSYKATDFDFFKFIANELFVIFVAYLVRDERWALLDAILKQTLHVKSMRPDPLLTFCHLSDHIALLDEFRNRRLAARRISMHADLLKERHTKRNLSQNLTWEEFMDADMILFLRGYGQSEHGGGLYWWPRTGVYLASHVPRYLTEAKTPLGAKHLATMLSIKNPMEVRESVKEALKFFFTGLRQMGAFHGFWNFDPDKIAATD